MFATESQEPQSFEIGLDKAPKFLKLFYQKDFRIVSQGVRLSDQRRTFQVITLL